VRQDLSAEHRKRLGVAKHVAHVDRELAQQGREGRRIVFDAAAELTECRCTKRRLRTLDAPRDVAPRVVTKVVVVGL
jgi:hypothetical protein